MAFNVKLARKALAWIGRNKASWNQDTWRCRSGMCFAGVVCELGGGKWLTSSRNDDLASFLVPEPGDLPDQLMTVKFRGREVKAIHARQRASRLLGITDYEDSCNALITMFGASLRLDQIRAEVNRRAEAVKANAS